MKSGTNPQDTINFNAQVFSDPSKVKHFTSKLPQDVEQVGGVMPQHNVLAAFAAMLVT